MKDFLSHIKIDRFDRSHIRLDALGEGGGEEPSEGYNHMYIISSSADEIKKYTIDDPEDPLTNLQLEQSVVLTANVSGLYIREDGLKLYTVDALEDTVYEYTMSTAFDITTLSQTDSKVVGSGVFTDTPRDLYFKDDGTIMYVTDAGDDYIYEYVLSTAWDISTATLNYTFSPPAFAPTGIFVKEDGQTIFMVDNSGDCVQEFNLSTAWDLSTASFVKESVDLDTIYDGFANPRGVFINEDGTKMYLSDTSQDSVFEFTLSTPYDIDTISLTNQFNPALNIVSLFFR